MQNTCCVYVQEKERLEQEKAELRAQLDAEVTSLQQNLKRLQQVGHSQGCTPAAGPWTN